MLPLRAALAAALLAVLLPLRAAVAVEAPPWLPRYEIAINLDTENARAAVNQNVTWTNRHQRPASELVFNVHSAYEPPRFGLDRLFLAKMLEIMRIPPREELYRGKTVELGQVSLLRRRGDQLQKVPLQHRWRDDISTALEVTLPEPVASGQSVSIAIEFTFNIPKNQGRWGQWKGITCLSNWLPVLAYYDEKGWDPVPFVAWHQPFFNEAGVYDVHLRLPVDEKVASSGSVRKRHVDGDSQELWIGPITTREFTLVVSKRFREEVAWAGKVAVKCLAFPEHEYYAKNITRAAAKAVETYSRWFGPYPNAELVFAESYFGWNGNECSGLVMVDERVFSMPKLGAGYVDYLISHETCHQWFYNVIGTDGYRETFMDEAFANYFAHRLMDEVHGKNNALVMFPRPWAWLPSIQRNDYRFAQFYGTVGRGELGPPVQEMPKYRHVVNLFSSAYDRGSKILGMIEERLGETAFLDFMRILYKRYYFRILFASDFQRALEEYTGKDWSEFFQIWLHGAGLTDWSLESAEVSRIKNGAPATKRMVKAVVYLKQKGDHDEPTTLGFSFGKDDEIYALRLPVEPRAGPIAIDDPPARIEPLADHRMRIEILLPQEPTQISVDPDQILPDRDPANNHWKHRYRFRVTPLYTFLDENNMTAAYDRWNYTFGPWLYGPAYSDPWFTRSSVVGVRTGAFRTEQASTGAYLGYRPNFRDIAAGFDAQWTNILFPKLEGGIHGEKSLTTLNGGGTDLDRIALWQRYVFHKASAMYTAPMQYLEGFASWQRNFLPYVRNPVPGSVRFEDMSNLGIHYHLDLLTPYWDPDIGFKFDITYAAGLPIFGQPEASHQVVSQLSWVHMLPAGLGYLSRTRLAYRLYGAIATPTEAMLFSLGGNQLFRGFDLRERQGSAVWIASMEWRLPVFSDLDYDVLDHLVGLRNVNVATFCDVGDIYVNQRSYGPVACAVGAGLRAELAWFSFLERTTLRVDVAKTVNADTPVQVWFGIMHPF